MEVANGTKLDTTANFGNTPTKGNNFVFKIWEVACIQDIIGTWEKFSYAATNSKHRKIKSLSKSRIKK